MITFFFSDKVINKVIPNSRIFMNNDKEHQFELMVRKHKRTIFTVCYMFSHDKTEIDDLFQEIAFS